MSRRNPAPGKRGVPHLGVYASPSSGFNRNVEAFFNDMQNAGRGTVLRVAIPKALKQAAPSDLQQWMAHRAIEPVVTRGIALAYEMGESNRATATDLLRGRYMGARPALDAVAQILSDLLGAKRQGTRIWYKNRPIDIVFRTPAPGQTETEWYAMADGWESEADYPNNIAPSDYRALADEIKRSIF